MKTGFARFTIVLLSSLLGSAAWAAEQAPKPDALQPAAPVKTAPDRIAPTIARPQAATKLPPPAPYVVYAGKNYYDLLLTRQCSSDSATCWLEGTNPSSLFAGKSLSQFENVSSQTSLWFGFPGSSAHQAPSTNAGVIVGPHGRLDPSTVGYVANMSMAFSFKVAPVPLCQQAGQLAVCPQVQNAYLRLHFK
jgi:hypothetical protein